MGYPQIQYSFSSVLKLENLASMNEPCTNDFIPKLQHFDTSIPIAETNQDVVSPWSVMMRS